MGWFDILKVEDIDFDDVCANCKGEGCRECGGTGKLRAFGVYSLENIHSHPLDVRMAIMDAFASGKKPEIKDLTKERIRINHKKIYDYLKQRLEREPTERELREFITRTIMHEATHAGMGLEQFTMSNRATEYGAITGQFPESTYYRLKTFLKHPASQTQILHPMFGAIGLETAVKGEKVKEIEELLAFVDALTDNLLGKYKEKVREKLTRMEITARTQKKNQSLKDINPSSLEDLTDRYGQKYKRFFVKLLLDAAGQNNVEFDDTELKMAGAVTTASAPAMFNKVVRGRKKRRKKDE